MRPIGFLSEDKDNDKDWRICCSVMDPLSIAASAASIAGLCGKILVSSAKFVEATGNVDDIFNGLNREVSTLSSVLESIGSTFKARPPQMPFEREHWENIKNLLNRCDRTLTTLKTLLDNLDKESFYSFARKP